MKKLFFFVVMLAELGTLNAQPGTSVKDSAWKKIYRGSYTKINDLVHTKLEVRFDYAKSWMYGKAWITLKPHFYSTDSLTLDAKGMDIKEVSLIKGTTKSRLKYTYNGLQLSVTLDKLYKGAENYTLYIDYTSKPEELEVKGSAAITDAKGLYFINPTGEDKDKPVQIWTQGETESNSVWMPTIDKPNQKSTEEIYMTVPAKYVTLSNGLLISQKKNSDGTRTDYWKMDLPHAPYLFFMGVGDFAIVKDRYKKIDVDYYVEKRYEPVARKIFGNTPEMIGFYEKILGVPYQWPKYDQIVGRDYVSGAMENTTATLHQESAYQNARQLVDGNAWEETIAHELFHQWFGDLVTAESWSNLTVNESFANYSEYLWDEYKYGKDAADEHNLEDMQGYLQSGSEKKDLVRFRYADKEDMFDAVSYNKGGRILHMLRNYVGDDAFFKSLNNYLINNKFKSGEAGQLRLAFEEVTGRDLNWFWNQWYYGSGHPKVVINYNYDSTAGKTFVYIKQTQTGDKIFRLPIAIDIYSGKDKKRYSVWMENKTDTIAFNQSTKPDLVNVDADKVLLWDKTDNKTAENFIHQYKYAPNYLDRKEALDFFNKKNMEELALGLTDKYAGLRRYTINLLSKSKLAADAKIVGCIESIANTEKDKKTKAAALTFLAATKDVKYKPLYNKFAGDSSYSVAGAALEGLSALDPAQSYTLAKKYSADAKGTLGGVVDNILIAEGTEADFDFIAGRYKEAPLSQEKIETTDAFCDYLVKVNDVAKVKKGISYLLNTKESIPEQYRGFTDPMFKAGLARIAKAKPGEVSDYIKNALK
ncbi:MAG: family metallopeptidase [Ferruginibacter sp.]|nr:family metallopeptidase [Ferruginibacter sp.]